MLRLHTVQTVAMISLLLEGWFEPPAVNGQHLSTLFMQMLSHVAQCGGAGIGPLYTTLCSQQAPFASIAKDEFAELVRHLGRKRLLMQDGGEICCSAKWGRRSSTKIGRASCRERVCRYV